MKVVKHRKRPYILVHGSAGDSPTVDKNAVLWGSGIAQQLPTVPYADVMSDNDERSVADYLCKTVLLSAFSIYLLQRKEIAVEVEGRVGITSKSLARQREMRLKQEVCFPILLSDN